MKRLNEFGASLTRFDLECSRDRGCAESQPQKLGIPHARNFLLLRLVSDTAAALSLQEYSSRRPSAFTYFTGSILKLSNS